MEQVRKLTKQAYSKTPWRSQTQLIGTFLLGVVVAALVTFIYLSTTAQAATYGRQIQEMQVKIYDPSVAVTSAALEAVLPEEEKTPSRESIEELYIQIDNLQAQLAELTSLRTAQAAVEKLNMQPNDPEKTMYLSVAGYAGRQAANLAPPPRIEQATTQSLPAVYKQSLIDWLKMKVVQTSQIWRDEVQP
jgi:soluble cytochrome b562